MPAAAQPWSSGVGDPGARSTDPDPIAWWTAPGRPAAAPTGWLATGAPPSFAGLALGGFDVDERGIVPAPGPWPALPAARRSLAWNDSLTVVALPDPGATGFGVPLVWLRGVPAAKPRTRTRSVVTFGEGSDAWSDNGLSIERGDSLGLVRGEVLAGSRGVSGSMGDGTRRVWDFAAQSTRGWNQLRVAYRQFGASGHLGRGLGESAEGETGGLAWRYDRMGRWAEIRLARGDDHRESSGDTLGWSRRDAGETRAEAEIGAAGLSGHTRLSASWSEANVRRTFADSAGPDRGARSAWVALQHDRAAGSGRLEATLGLGRCDAVRGIQLAPWAAWRAPLAGGGLRLAAGRWLAPVWSDLAPGQPAFLQSTWAAGAQWNADRPGWHGDLLLAGGATRDPARVGRLPLDDLWLRRGLLAGEDVRFGLAAGGAAWTLGAWSAGAGGFGLGRDADGGPRVDPRWGARAFAGWRGAFFQGDLGATLQVMGDAIGGRQVDAPGGEFLPGYASLGATCVLTLADATVVLEGRNLDNQSHPEPWLDPATGEPARGPGLTLRMVVRLRLYN